MLTRAEGDLNRLVPHLTKQQTRSRSFVNKPQSRWQLFLRLAEKLMICLEQRGEAHVDCGASTSSLLNFNAGFLVNLSPPSVKSH